MRRRTFVSLAGLVLSGSTALAGCAAEEYPAQARYPYSRGGGAAPANGRSGRREAVILLPLSGPHAGLGNPMLQAAQLALAQGGPPLIPGDTGGSPQGAGSVLQGALGSGAGIVLGPLLGATTEAITPIATQAGVPVLAFTNTASVAQPGVWTLGITPAQQVERVVRYARAQGRSRFAAFLPDSAFGRALASAFGNALVHAGLQPVAVRFHGHGMAAVSTGLRSLSDFASRWGDTQAKIRKLHKQNSPAARQEAEQLTRSPPPPPPFDALLLGDTGEALAEVASMLTYYFVLPSQVQVMGPSLWAAASSGSHRLHGAIYAAPDAGDRAGFVQAFTARYGAPPPGPADLAYDAASIAVQTAPAGYSLDALTNPAGFQGVDGWLRLLPNGHVERALAVFQIEAGGPRPVAPASPPTT